MCLNSSIFPLVKLKNGKRKILFQADLKLTNIEDYNNIKNEIDRINSSIRLKNKDYYIPGNQYLKRLMKQENVVSFERFIAVPCGHCEDCLTNNARSWSIRILKEAEQYEHNYFITLTYDDEHLPKNGSLDKEAISSFNKALKQKLGRDLKLPSDFRFYAVGEYGEKEWRPHYHSIMFNLFIPDLKFVYTSSDGFPVYESKILNDVWKKGFVQIEDVSIGSACYVARYCDKKKKNLSKQDLEFMHKIGLDPEFSRMSRRPGIGANYLNTILDKIKNGNFKIHYKNNDFSIPKYYSNKFEELLEPQLFQEYKNYNIDISDNFVYKNLMYYSGLDIEELKMYTESNRVLHKKKRGF